MMNRHAAAGLLSLLIVMESICIVPAEELTSINGVEAIEVYDPLYSAVPENITIADEEILAEDDSFIEQDDSFIEGNDTFIEENGLSVEDDIILEESETGDALLDNNEEEISSAELQDISIEEAFASDHANVMGEDASQKPEEKPDPITDEKTDEEPDPVGAGKKLPAPVITGVYNSKNGGDIYWNRVSGAPGYIVYRFRAAEKTIKIAEVDSSTTHIYDRSILNNCWGRVYHYYVVAVRNGQAGNWSKPAVLQRVAAVEINSLTAASSTSARISWQVVSGAQNKAYGYQVQYAENSNDLFKRTGTFRYKDIRGRGNTSATVSGLKTGKTYYFRVRSYVEYTNSVNGAYTKTWSQYSNPKSLNVNSQSGNAASLYRNAILGLGWSSAAFAVADINGDGVYEAIVEAVVSNGTTFHPERKGVIFYISNGSLKRFTYGPGLDTLEAVNSNGQLVFGRTRGKAIISISSFSPANGVANVTSFFMPYLSEAQAAAMSQAYLSGLKYLVWKPLTYANVNAYLSGNGSSTGLSNTHVGNGLSNNG